VRGRLALFAVLLAAYAATLGIPADGDSNYTRAAAHHLLTAESIVSDGDLDLRDEYATRAWEDWYPGDLEPTATLTNGRLHEPQGVGFPLLIAPAYAVGGPTGVELFLAAMFAAAFVLVVPLARRLVPDPWPLRAAVVVGLSPPALAAATTVAPSTAGAVLLTGAVGLALRVRDAPRLPAAAGCAALLAVLPWLAIGLIAPALVVALALARWLRRRNRGLAGFTALELVLFSSVFYVVINDRLFGGAVPDAARLGGASSATGIHDAGDVLERLPRLAGVLIDRDVGVVRWAPVLLLALWALWLLFRSLRERVAIAFPERIDVEVAAGLLALVAAAGVLVAALSPRVFAGPSLVPYDLPVVLPVVAALVAWGSRHAPRVSVVLAGVTLVASAWLLIGVRIDDGTQIGPPRGGLPWAGAQEILPRVTSGDVRGLRP
jgi:hypothetical protein